MRFKSRDISTINPRLLVVQSLYGYKDDECGQLRLVAYLSLTDWALVVNTKSVIADSIGGQDWIECRGEVPYN